MGMEVYANGMSIACKAAAGKTIAAMPDVCLSPPTPPAGPVPIPYPNTAMASDTTNGSKTVQINSEEVMLKDQSTFKQSNGDEAATKSLGMGVVTACIQGEVAFVAWSMDVKFEGANVPRHLDLTLHNEQSVPANTPTWPYIDAMTMASDHPCAADKKKEEEACKDYDPHKPGGGSPCPPGGKPGNDQEAEVLATKTAGDKCLAARRCQLVPYKPTGKQARCCDGQTGHHLVEAGSFFGQGRGGKSVPISGNTGYHQNRAPCVCVEGTNQYHGTHGLMHAFQSCAAEGTTTDGTLALAQGDPISTRVTTYGTARNQGAGAMTKTFPQSGCNEDCIKKQLDAYHSTVGMEENTPIRSIEEGYSGPDAEEAAQTVVQNRTRRLVEMGLAK
ncbi:MAG TPA: PAAR-like domain-containing protein [Tepidisphaeraceae bacterium]|nr:PAAR-like domain-containing protein [Tepidisphaeraceae bacterium]